MRPRSPDEDTLEIAGIPAPLAEFLRQIPASARPGRSRAARRRLFSSPVSDPADPLAADWAEHVAPELEHLFRSATELVAGDLRSLRKERRPPDDPASYRLRIPRKHAEAWLSALNQARIVIGEKIRYREGDRLDPSRIDSDPRALQIAQMDFYALLQEWLLAGITAD